MSESLRHKVMRKNIGLEVSSLVDDVLYLGKGVNEHDPDQTLAESCTDRIMEYLVRKETADAAKVEEQEQTIELLRQQLIAITPTL